jgi:hypothetical protein
MSARNGSTLLASAVAKVVLSARRLVDHLAAPGVHHSASGSQKVLLGTIWTPAGSVSSRWPR